MSNLWEVLARAKAGEEIEVCSGVDDVCKRCPYLEGDRCFYDRDADAEIREMDSKAIELLKLKVNMKVTWQEIKVKIPELIHEWSNGYCKKCDWRKVCEANFLMTSGFKGYEIQP